MLDLEPFYNEVKVIENFNAIGPDGRSVYVLSALILDTFYPILYTSLILGAYIKLFKNSKILLFGCEGLTDSAMYEKLLEDGLKKI